MGTFVYRARRSEMRRAFAMTCSVVRERDFRLIGGEALDVSPAGMLIRVKEPIAVGDSVIVSFRATELDLWFDTDAIVTRLVRGRRPKDPAGQSIGVTFCSLDAVSRLILRAFLRRFPPPVPRREQVVDYAATVRKILSMGLAA
jgi:hypothetical protein